MHFAFSCTPVRCSVNAVTQFFVRFWNTDLKRATYVYSTKTSSVLTRDRCFENLGKFIANKSCSMNGFTLLFSVSHMTFSSNSDCRKLHWRGKAVCCIYLKGMSSIGIFFQNSFLLNSKGQNRHNANFIVRDFGILLFI